MASLYITAFEHEPLLVESGFEANGISAEEADYLALLGEMRPGFCEHGYRSVRLAQYCGVVGLGNRILEILPKVDEKTDAAACRGVLLRLLRESNDFPLFRHLSVGQHLRHAPLLELFIAAFLDAVLNIVRGGLLREYSEEEDDLCFVRGRIRAERQFAALSNRPDLVACRFDELTADNLWNQLVKVGLCAVRPWIVSDTLHRRWVDLVAVFDEISELQASPQVLSRLTFDRRAMRYREVTEWVRWLLSLLSPALRAGVNTAPALLFDMNKLFESAVSSALRRGAYGKSIQISSQEGGHYLSTLSGTGRRAFGLRPDLIARSGGRVVAIADTKWKLLEVSGSRHLKPAEEDIYQMHAYASAFACENLVLIYPRHSGLNDTLETRFQLPDMGPLRPTVQIVCVDVHKDPFNAEECARALGLIG